MVQCPMPGLGHHLPVPPYQYCLFPAYQFFYSGNLFLVPLKYQASPNFIQFVCSDLYWMHCVRCNFDILFTCKNFDQFQPSLNIWCKKALIFLLLMNSKSNVPLSDVVISLLFFQIEEIERKYPITGVWTWIERWKDGLISPEWLWIWYLIIFFIKKKHWSWASIF